MLYMFGILTSNVHNAWMRTVAGRMKSDYQYSASVVYNTFAWPTPSDKQKEKIIKTAQGILDARKIYRNNSLAQLYNEITMPVELRTAHQKNDIAVIFDKLIDKLKDNYKVYAIDSRCHGKSENPIDISYDLMCDDIIDFIKKLNIEKPILYGFSDGGIIGLLVAIKEPNLLSKLIVSGANITPNAFTAFDDIITKLFYFFTRSKYIKMMLKEPNIPLKDLQSIIIPVYVLAGEKDVIKLEHTKLIADNIKNSIMEIIPKEKHGSYIIHSAKIYEIIKKYIGDKNEI